MSSAWLGPADLLRSLDQLAACGRDLVQRQGQTSTTSQERERLTLRRLDAAAKASEERCRTEQDTARRSAEEDAARLQARAKHRTQRIRQAQIAVRKAAAQRTEAEEGRRKFEIQRELLRATRERDAGLAEAKGVFDHLTSVLDASQSQLTSLELTAQRLFSVFGSSVRSQLIHAHESASADVSPTEAVLAESLATELEGAHHELTALSRRFLPALSRAWPLTLFLILCPVAVVPALQYFRIHYPSWPELGGLSAGLALLALGLHFLGRRLALPTVHRILTHLGNARTLLHACREKAGQTHQATRTRLEATFESVAQHSNLGWSELAEWLESRRNTVPAEIEARANRILARSEALLKRQLQDREARLQETLQRLRQQADDQLQAARVEADRSRAASHTEQTEAARERSTEWNRDAAPVLERLEAFRLNLANHPLPEGPNPDPAWSPPLAFTPAVRFGTLTIDLPRVLDLPPALAPVLPPWAGQPAWSLPLLLRLPTDGSLLIDADPSRRAEALATLNRVICHLLASAPPGRIAFTVFDPVGLGQSFAGLTHLADEAEHLIHGRIWTQSAQIEDRLAELNDHLEKVIQMYLRNEFPTIAEYNQQAGTIAEKYRFLVLADFPSGFSDLALRRLQAIATTGARCGVFLLAHRNTSLPVPADFPLAAVRNACVRLTLSAPTAPAPLLLNDRSLPAATLRLEPPADPEAVNVFIHQVARANRDSHRVEVPFAQIAPKPGELWSADSATELRVAIGRTGATKLQMLALGKGTRQHALIAGKTGSGKSTLFHVLITNLALWYRPDQVEFYLIDFKKGVEFKCYATHRLPHARVVAIESDRDFGLSVLQRLDEELRRRGELFRNARVQDIASYRQSPNALPMPRVLLLVDEFQEFFTEEDRIAQNASVLLDRIVRQGRAFGIHVILGSQTLGGAYTVARTTLGQMAVRIALQCNEADALLIMDDENPAPRLLSRPGEAIYNDASGSSLGNSPFQIVWLPDDVRDAQLRLVRQTADQSATPLPAPVVFEGDAPAEISENAPLQALLRHPATVPATLARTWLGSPNSIKDPTEVPFARRSAENLLIVGQRDDAILGLAGIALAALAAQFPPQTVEFTVLDGSPPHAPDHPYFEALAKTLRQTVHLARPADAGSALQHLHQELRTRIAESSGEASLPRFLLIHGLQQFRNLRQEDEFSFGAADAPPSPASMLKELLSEGPPQGLHVLVSCDTFSNVLRFLGRKGLGEFAHRVLFQMSANDSASLIDSPAASRLGLHRALLYSDREGHLEVFRPYALPTPEALQPAN